MISWISRKIEADAIKITYEQLDVSELMDTIYASAKLRVPGGVKLILEKGADHHMFGTDSMRLLQLINNLVNTLSRTRKKVASRWDIPFNRIINYVFT